MMMLRSWSSLSALALMCAALSCAGTAAADIGQLSGCQKPRYPRPALERGEDGISLLGFLVGADGMPLRSIVVDSSGSEQLDRATQDALMKCRWKPRSPADGPEEQWRLISYTWTIDGDPDMVEAKKRAALAAGKGELAARYRISRLLSNRAKTDQDRRNALTLLRSAADLGYAPAEYDLGLHYEQGIGMAADTDEALRWYGRAADHGNVFALQRIQTGRREDIWLPCATEGCAHP